MASETRICIDYSICYATSIVDFHPTNSLSENPQFLLYAVPERVIRIGTKCLSEQPFRGFLYQVFQGFGGPIKVDLTSSSNPMLSVGIEEDLARL